MLINTFEITWFHVDNTKNTGTMSQMVKFSIFCIFTWNHAFSRVPIGISTDRSDTEKYLKHYKITKRPKYRLHTVLGWLWKGWRCLSTILKQLKFLKFWHLARKGTSWVYHMGVCAHFRSFFIHVRKVWKI